MKKILKNQKIKYLLFFILGGLIIGGIGITATTYVLQANEIEYKNNKSVQEAIEELYTMAQDSGGGKVNDLNLTPEVLGSNINISYTGTYTGANCVYGTEETYGNIGKIENNKCVITGVPNVTYYYKIAAINSTGEVYIGSGSSTANAGATVVKTGLPQGTKAIIYLDPTNLGATCNESNSTVGGTATSGCMKWYAFKEDDTSYTMILDHNTTVSVEWNSSGSSTSMLEVKQELNRLVSTTKWKVTPRLITGQEIADITGISWSASGGSVFFNGSNTPSDYYWLYDYTAGCTSNGCKVADSNSNNYVYWTDTPYAGNSTDVWYVRCDGTLRTGNAYYEYGLRPVITVQKSNL